MKSGKIRIYVQINVLGDFEVVQWDNAEASYASLVEKLHELDNVNAFRGEIETADFVESYDIISCGESSFYLSQRR